MTPFDSGTNSSWSVCTAFILRIAHTATHWVLASTEKQMFQQQRHFYCSTIWIFNCVRPTYGGINNFKCWLRTLRIRETLSFTSHVRLCCDSNPKPIQISLFHCTFTSITLDLIHGSIYQKLELVFRSGLTFNFQRKLNSLKAELKSRKQIVKTQLYSFEIYSQRQKSWIANCEQWKSLSIFLELFANKRNIRRTKIWYFRFVWRQTPKHK